MISHKSLEIINVYIGRLKYGKDDSDHGFTSENLINDTHNIVLTLLFNIMISRGYTPTKLLKATLNHR